MLYSYDTGYFFSAAFTLYGSGISFSIESASAITISSVLPVLPAAAFYYVDKMASNVAFVSFLSFVMSALAWNP